MYFHITILMFTKKIFRSETKITKIERVVLSSALLFTDNSEDERFCFANSLKFHLMYFEVLSHSHFQAELIGFKGNFNFQMRIFEGLENGNCFRNLNAW